MITELSETSAAIARDKESYEAGLVDGLCRGLREMRARMQRPEARDATLADIVLTWQATVRHRTGLAVHVIVIDQEIGKPWRVEFQDRQTREYIGEGTGQTPSEAFEDCLWTLEDDIREAAEVQETYDAMRR